MWKLNDILQNEILQLLCQIRINIFESEMRNFLAQFYYVASLKWTFSKVMSCNVCKVFSPASETISVTNELELEPFDLLVRYYEINNIYCCQIL